MVHVNGEEEPVDADELDHEDDVPYESITPVVEGGMDAHRPKTDASGKASSNYTKYDPKHPDAKKNRKGYEELKKKNPGLGRSLPPSEVEEGCGCPGAGGHDEPRGHGIAVSMKDDLTDDKKPVIKVVKMKKKPALPTKIMRAITSALGFGESNTVNEEWTEDDQRDKMEHNSRDNSSWSAMETIEWHGNEVVAAGADFLDQELLHPKVNKLEDVHQDLLDDLAGMVIHDMQKSGNLPNRLDYNDYLDERDEYKAAIEDYLDRHFDEMVDIAEDRAVERGDRTPSDW